MNSQGKRRVSRPIKTAQSGFSLIEILLVVGIIAFIATMVATNIIGSSETAKIKNAASAVRLIAAKASSYYIDVGVAPTKLEDLIVKPGDAQNWKGPYITESQSKDPWNTPYVLKAPGEHTELDVMSYGADRQEGGTGNNADIGNWQ